ncbi:nucleolar pre-ribosomal-associated protein 1 [Orussus abietinus]|uniref:nucleolar pre-ribosomal-associated protein 1 n=1 Tax=Orussus abietinus TaxID=222816 RepID=UPI000625D137|nr:nucleolar pre-ribosomal-associated protein 1 [Orussus abietinus]
MSVGLDNDNSQTPESFSKEKRKSKSKKSKNNSDSITDKTECVDSHVVEGKKERKRKSNADDGEILKLRKKSKDGQLNGADDLDDSVDTKLQEKPIEEGNKEEDVHENECSDDECLSPNDAGKLTGKSLRAGLKSSNPMNFLKKFIIISKQFKERDVAGEYLEAGGSIIEVLKLLDSPERKNVAAATSVFSAVYIIIMKILSQYPQYQSNAEETCRHLIHSYFSFVHSMLSLHSNAKQRKVALKLLAAIISLGGTLPQELLSHLSLHGQFLETVTKHSKPTDSESVRTCFIHFILAFLVEGNVLVIRTLLDKRRVLSSIFPGLLYDPHILVNVVLMTIKKYVLENPGISKTLKIHTFSTPVVQTLVSLYNWKGPNGCPGYAKHNATLDVVNPQEKQVAVDAVHEFLITLLTSNRYGIIFHDRSLGTSGRKHNQLVDTVLQRLDRPWEHEKPSELVVKILIACPDLVKVQLTYTEPFLEPRLSRKWFMVMKFIEKIILSMDAESCIKLCQTELGVPQLVNAVITLSVPPTVLKNAIMPSLCHDNIIVQHEGIKLLVVMLNKLKDFINITRFKNKRNLVASTLVQSAKDYLLKNVPSLHFLLKLWEKAVGSEPDVKLLESREVDAIPPIKECLIEILNLFEVYHDLCPEAFDTGLTSDSDSYPLTLLDALKNQHEMDESDICVLKVKLLQFLLTVDSAMFSPQKKHFMKVLSLLLSIQNNEAMSADVTSNARAAVNVLLRSSGMFEGFNDQVEIWINAFSFLCDQNERGTVVDWFVTIMKNAIKHTNKYESMITEAEEAAGEQIPNTRKIQDIFNELAERDLDSYKTVKACYFQPTTSISPLFCSAIESLRKTSSELVLQYFAFVAVHVMHCQVAPGPLIYLSKDVKDLPSLKYLTSWLHEGDPVHVKKPFGSKNTICKLSKALLAQSRIKLSEILNEGKSLSFKCEEEEVEFSSSFTPFEFLSTLRMTLFTLIQLAQRGSLSEEQSYNCKVAILALLRVAEDTKGKEAPEFISECLKLIFRHPVLLQYFSPINSKKDSMEKRITEIIFHVCSKASDMVEPPVSSELFLPFKQKLIEQLVHAINDSTKGGKRKKSSIAADFINILQLTTEDVTELFKNIIQLPAEKFLAEDVSQFSMWGVTIPKLLDILSRKESSETKQFIALDIQPVGKVFAYLVRLKKIAKADLELWEDSLYKYLQRFPHNIEGVGTNAFKSLLEGPVKPATLKLLILLTSRSHHFIPAFIKHVMDKQDALDNSIILPLLSNNLDYKWDPKFLEKLDSLYRDDILRYFSDMSNANPLLEENFKGIIYLMQEMFDIDSCKIACQTILSDGDKLNNVSVFGIKLLEGLFKKLAALEPENSAPLKDLSQILIRILTSALKKDSRNDEKLTLLCKTLCDVIDDMNAKFDDFEFDELTKNSSWPQFVRFALRLGLKTTKEDNVQCSLLKTLTTTINVAYKDDSDLEFVKTLFEMTVSHSEFVGIMLTKSSVKRYLVELLWVLIRKNNTVMKSTQVPLYLSAYNATLEESDQLILMILGYYESHDIRLHEYRPYLWGEAAASHFSVKGEIDTAIWRQPTTSQVLDLFSSDLVNNTLKNFPVHRTLKGQKLHEADAVYDPAFYLPLLCYLLSDNNVVACHKVTHSGALALVLAACGSTCDDIRMAAYSAISKFYFHVETTSSKEKLLWMRLIDSLRSGMATMEIALKDMRLNCLVSTFMARTSLIFSQPLNPLYAPLQNFFAAKRGLNLRTIPEFLQLFHSSDIQHLDHRHWILEVVRDGLRTEEDAKVAFNCFLFRMLFDFYMCTLCDRETKNLILQVVDSAGKIPKSGELLVNGYALLPWLNEVAVSLDPQDQEAIGIVVDICNDISKIIRHSCNERFMLLNVLVTLKSRLSASVGAACFGNYLIALDKLLDSKQSFDVITTEDLKDLVGLLKEISGDVGECEDMLRYGCKYRVMAPKDGALLPEECLRKIILKRSEKRCTA